MGEIRFDHESNFGDDYLWFYEGALTEDRSRGDATEITETLGLESGASILDAPCGHGRISNMFAADGFTVTGVDITELYLDRATEDARKRGVTVDYRVGDLRTLPVDGPFDAVINWFTSFGYFDDDGNQAVLSEFARVLRPGGKLLIETMHHDGFVGGHIPAPAAHVVERGDDVMTDVTSFDSVTGRIETDRTFHRNGATRRTHFSIRLPTVPEFDVWLEAAGFSHRSYATRNGEPLHHDSWRLVVVATK